MSQDQQTTRQDDLLSHMIGKWRITREFKKRTMVNTATVSWELDGHWLRIDMKDVAKPSQYEAHVYLTRMLDGSYSCHWLDTFGGTLPESLGVGKRVGDSIVIDFKDKDGELRNTFTWHPDSKTWTSHIEQTDAKGVWTVFCTDTYKKRS